jgi:hypothetical protein
MCNSTASAISRTAIGEDLVRRGVDLMIAIEDGNVLIQCQVSSAVADRMLAPLKRKASGHCRRLSANLVEIDALMTTPMAVRVLQARKAALAENRTVH